MLASATVNHRLHVEVDAFARRGDVVTGFDDVRGFAEDIRIVSLDESYLRVVIVSAHMVSCFDCSKVYSIGWLVF